MFWQEPWDTCARCDHRRDDHPRECMECTCHKFKQPINLKFHDVLNLAIVGCTVAFITSIIILGVQPRV